MFGGGGGGLGSAALPGEQILFWVEHFSEGPWCSGKPTGSHKSCFHCKNGRKATRFSLTQ